VEAPPGGAAAYCGVVAVEFLSDAEAAAYGRYDRDPSREELDRVFFLDDADRDLVAKRRGEHNRLGFALQLTTARWLGVFLPDPTAVPETGLNYVARQLEVEDPSCAGRYLERRRTRFEHVEEIKLAGGLRDFAQARSELAEWVTARAWMTGDGPRAMFVDAVGWLRERDVLLPGVTTLTRLLASARADGDERLWATLAEVPTVEQARVLEGLLEVATGSRFSDLERWRKGPGDPTGKSLRLSLGRVAEIHEAGIPLAQALGGGMVAGIDGMRFIVPVPSIYARPNRKYFGPHRGVTWLNVISDQAVGLAGKVVSGANPWLWPCQERSVGNWLGCQGQGQDHARSHLRRVGSALQRSLPAPQLPLNRGRTGLQETDEVRRPHADGSGCWRRPVPGGRKARQRGG
jgi:hypothetical protein